MSKFQILHQSIACVYLELLTRFLLNFASILIILHKYVYLFIYLKLIL